ncbi:hypothetical protein BOX15_Mlig022205g2, partial [Macrostomum lignano]
RNLGNQPLNMAPNQQFSIAASLANGTGLGCSRTCIAVRAVTIPVAAAGLLLSCLWLLILIGKYRRNPEPVDIGLILMQLAFTNFCLAALCYVAFELALLKSGHTRWASFKHNVSFAAIYCWFLLSLSLKNLWMMCTCLFRFMAISRPMKFRRWLTCRIQLCSFAVLLLVASAVVFGAFAGWRLTAGGSEQFLVNTMLPLTRTTQTYLPVPLIVLISALTVAELAAARANRPGDNIASLSPSSTHSSGADANTNAIPATEDPVAAAAAAAAACENAALAAAECFNASVMSSEDEDGSSTKAMTDVTDAIEAARAAAAANQYSAKAAKAVRALPERGSASTTCARAAKSADAAAAAAANFATAASALATDCAFTKAANAAAAASASAVAAAAASNAFAFEAAISAESAAVTAAAAAAAAATSATAANVCAAKALIKTAATVAAAAAADSNDIEADCAAIAAKVYAFAADDATVATANYQAADTAGGVARNFNAMESRAAANSRLAGAAAAAAVAATAAAAANSNAVATAAATVQARNWCNTLLIVCLSAGTIAALELPGAVMVIVQQFRPLQDWLVPVDDLLVTCHGAVHFAIFGAFSANFRGQLRQLLRCQANRDAPKSGRDGQPRQQENRPLVGTKTRPS